MKDDQFLQNFLNLQNFNNQEKVSKPRNPTKRESWLKIVTSTILDVDTSHTGVLNSLGIIDGHLNVFKPSACYALGFWLLVRAFFVRNSVVLWVTLLSTISEINNV